MQGRRTVLLSLCLLAGLPPASAVAEQGVHIDPNSPAGKEYAIPIAKARREAVGAPTGTAKRGGGRSSDSSGSAPFGEGIKPVGRSATSARQARPPRGRAHRQPAGVPSGASAAPSLNAASVAAGEGSALLPMGLIVVAALLAAGGLGFLLRRGLR
jgi:hypothetical protein